LHLPILSQSVFFLHHPNLAPRRPGLCAVTDQRLTLAVRPGRLDRVAQALLAPLPRRCPSEFF
jgi:hypothetical protein